MFRILAALLMLVVGTGSAIAQQTGRVVVGFAAGGALDAMSRVVADALREGLGQPFISENRAGAEGRIAIDTVALDPGWRSRPGDMGGKRWAGS